MWAGLLKKNKKPWVGNNLNVKQGEIALITDYYAVLTNALKECLMLWENVHNIRRLKMWLQNNIKFKPSWVKPSTRLQTQKRILHGNVSALECGICIQVRQTWVKAGLCHMTAVCPWASRWTFASSGSSSVIGEEHLSSGSLRELNEISGPSGIGLRASRLGPCR